MLEVRTSPFTTGEFTRGVFATRKIAKGELIHEAPVVTYPNEEHELIEQTVLDDYVFNFGANHGAIVLGYGSLFNHSYTPNAVYELSFEKLTVDFFAYADIESDEEVLINYNGEPDCDDPLWFLYDPENTESK
ncbi:SET domain-containing protein [Paenibacillus herberti]|uniref:SET domain-containing protein-lysine N-methyltransferase n=1 Tax=Paenibacillus herberti TaxID=1619309 RepID=A0A229P050_9BACL|nr:SET domain-containing protein [Paenibacillus herberti]OXM15478.1 SET domain-containing protein-lysine N-methyltransferase [Paenibacillus herberti]